MDILPAWLIDAIERYEKEQRQWHDNRPRVEIPEAPPRRMEPTEPELDPVEFPRQEN